MITTLVLGARDPEMDAVGRLALSARLDVVWARKAGKPVGYDQMYAADSPAPGPGQLWVECCPPGGKSDIDFADHHEPGDPGFGRPPDEFWEASSLGQVWARLRPGESPPEALLVTAAADHCPQAAYRGECRGVDPGQVVARSAEQIAESTGATVAEVLASVYRRIHAMQAARPRQVAGARVHHEREVLRSDREWLVLREAALWHGLAVVGHVLSAGGEEWVKLAGHVTPRLARAFMAGEVVPGLVRVYGDERRGYAGGMVARS